VLCLIVVTLPPGKPISSSKKQNVTRIISILSVLSDTLSGIWVLTGGGGSQACLPTRIFEIG
jgi:hypothetical protein